MAAKSVQISLPGELLKQIDSRPETRKHGRSAVIQQALQLYLDSVERREIDRAYARAYAGKADEIGEEFGPLMEKQRWPET